MLKFGIFLMLMLFAGANVQAVQCVECTAGKHYNGRVAMLGDEICDSWTICDLISPAQCDNMPPDPSLLGRVGVITFEFTNCTSCGGCGDGLPRIIDIRP